MVTELPYSRVADRIYEELDDFYEDQTLKPRKSPESDLKTQLWDPSEGSIGDDPIYMPLEARPVVQSELNEVSFLLEVYDDSFRADAEKIGSEVEKSLLEDEIPIEIYILE